jgi:tetratricopeptide (TPR) repeat protein
MEDARIAAEGKEYALRAVELGVDDAFALSRAALCFGLIKDAGTADAIVDQAIAVNPNLSDAWRVRGWISFWLGQHEQALEQFQYAMRLNPLDPRSYAAETDWRWPTSACIVSRLPYVGYQIDGAPKKLRSTRKVCFSQLRHAGTYSRCSNNG